MGGVWAGVLGMSDIRPFLRIIFYSSIYSIYCLVCNFQVRIGDYDLSVVGETSIAEKTLGVAAVRRHENFIVDGNNGIIDWDIAVLELTEHLDLETVTPSCLARTSDRTSFDGEIVDNIVSCRTSLKPSVRHNKFPTFSGRSAQAYGWGATVSGGTYSDKGVQKDLLNNYKDMRFCGLGLNRSQSSQIRDLEKHFAQHFVLTFGSFEMMNIETYDSYKNKMSQLRRWSLGS